MDSRGSAPGRGLCHPEPPKTGYDSAAFAASLRPDAAEWDARGGLPPDVVKAVAHEGFLATDRAPGALGALCADFGSVCSSLRALVTVQGMVAAAVRRWGTAAQRERWLPALARGAVLAGFAATEPGAGSDLSAVTTSAEREGGQVRLRGRKLWVTFGQLADVFLVLATAAGRPVTVLVEADRPGVDVEPVRGQLGMRAAQLAHVRFDGVLVPAENLLAPPGFGLSHVVATALDHGRFTVAWGCVGMAEACLRAAADHAADRVQGGVRLAGHQTVRALLGRSLADTTAARELCARAATLREHGDPGAVAGTVLAKYVAARAAAAVADRAGQVLGAAGCAEESPVGRFFRDAKVMRIIEGADEVAEQQLGEYALRWRP
ncbi:Acyl-CoA dehydrogenase [Amycolatopsis tolypomycina]|uniref:Acyl-CoA dehydrogenase n=1 Tax=Amycolatopsis tolypomycina TaxID=208445 RepID=A0A1H4X9L9_9PSEU|nr:acyl-CoA dehydrogenase family protein [Amycolatopsis tolypomycina]SED02267.1 Acyl-CoA dehydrogenase [Amycolatopsis tolypomycina]